MPRTSGQRLSEVFGGLQETRFSYLLLLLFLLFFLVIPLAGATEGSFPWMGSLIYLLIFLLIFTTALSLTGRNRLAFLTLFLLSLLAVTANLLFLVLRHPGWLVLHHASTGLVLLFFTVSLVRYLFLAQSISRYTLYAAICSYLLIALIGALFYGFLDLLDPAAFHIPERVSPDGRLAVPGSAYNFHSLYFSLVTLTTLGYGDIVPVSNPARMLASGQALFGQLFIAIIVARLVGIQVAQAGREPLQPS